MFREKPLVEVDFGELNIRSWNYKDFLSCPDSHKVVLENESHLITISIEDIDQLDFFDNTDAICQPTIFSKIHLYGEVMPYETHTYVSSIEKTSYNWSDNYIIMTLVKTEAETEELASPITIKIKDCILSDKYKNMLKDIKVNDFFRLKAKIINTNEEKNEN